MNYIFARRTNPTVHLFPFLKMVTWWSGFPGGSDSKESACNMGDLSWIGKIPWRRNCQPTSAFLPEESHGQRSLVGFSQWRCKDSNTNEQITHMKWQPIYQSCQRCHRCQRREKWWILKIYLIIFRPIGILPGVDALVCHSAPHFGTETLIPLLLGVLSADDSSSGSLLVVVVQLLSLVQLWDPMDWREWFSGAPLLSPWSSECWQFDLWFRCLL